MISVSANPIDTDWLRAWHSKSKACWSVETTGCCSDFTTLLWDISSKNIFRSFAFSKKYLLTTLSRRCHLLLRVFELRFCCFLRAFLIDKPLYETRKGHTLWPIVRYSAKMYFLNFLSANKNDKTGLSILAQNEIIKPYFDILSRVKRIQYLARDYFVEFTL